jgi:hypothetical protein
MINKLFWKINVLRQCNILNINHMVVPNSYKLVHISPSPSYQLCIALPHRSILPKFPSQQGWPVEFHAPTSTTPEIKLKIYSPDAIFTSLSWWWKLDNSLILPPSRACTIRLHTGNWSRLQLFLFNRTCQTRIQVLWPDYGNSTMIDGCWILFPSTWKNKMKMRNT